MKPSQTGFACLLILLLGLLIVKAGEQGLSDFYALLAQQGIDRSSGANSQDKDAQWQRSMGYVTEALHYAPKSAWPLEAATELRLRRLQAATDRRRRVVEALTMQINIRAQLQERPTAPQAWANLALAKYAMGETGPALTDALSNAQVLGPWENDTQTKVIVVGLSAWQHLDAGQRAQLLATLERAAQRNIEKVAIIAQALKRIDLFCDIKYVQAMATSAATSATVRACMKSIRK